MAWANMLHRLVKENEGDRSWDLWPIVPVSKNDYWFSLLPDVVKIVKDRRMDVFPTVSPSPSYASIGDSNVLFATESINEVVLATLKKAGLNIVHPPSSLLEVIRSVDAEKILQPAAVAHALSVSTILVPSKIYYNIIAFSRVLSGTFPMRIRPYCWCIYYPTPATENQLKF